MFYVIIQVVVYMKKLEKSYLIILFIITFMSLLPYIQALINTEWYQISKIVLSIMGCLFVLIIIIYTILFSNKIPYKIPNFLYLSIITFCFISIVLGDVNDFYGKFASFDSYLHFSFGSLCTILGFTLLNTLSLNIKNFKLPVAYMCIIAFCFTSTLGVCWEIFEYSCDTFLGTNMQTYLKTTSSSFPNAFDIPLTGHEALKDTMEDLILNSTGSLVIYVIGYNDIKHNKKSFINNRIEKFNVNYT